MIKDFFVSFTDNIKEKTRNPFLGTYAVVWLIRNWYVVYMVFNFDKDCTMDDKLRLISEYFESHPFWENIGINILYTFGVLLATYILLNLSRLIVNGFERNLTPWIYKVTDKSSIVTKDTYQESLSRIKKMEADLESEKEKRYRAEEKSEILEKELRIIRDKKVIPKEEVVFNKLVKENRQTSFEKYANEARRYGDITIEDNEDNEDIDRLLELELVSRSVLYVGVNEEVVYKLTELGNAVLDYINSL